MEKPKASVGKNPGALPVTKTPVPAAKAPAPATALPPLPPLFRKIDWLTLATTFLFVFVGYYLTLAPEMTLEDSGELAVGSYYAGIPHPPGYPVWTIFTWLWTELLPFGNVAWRVGVSSAFSGALASGLLAIVVSRGSSMIIESIDDLKKIDRRWENIICLVSGFVAGTLIGFNGYMWSQSVIVEVYPLSVASLLGVVVCLMRWVYAPHQHRYLYFAFFLYGICVNNHQTLLVIAMGMQVLIWLAEPKLGREFFFWNTLIYLAGLAIGPTILTGNTPVFVIYNSIGIGSAGLWLWLVITTKKTAIEFGRDAVMLVILACVAAFFGGMTNYIEAANGTMTLVLIAAAGVAASLFFARLVKQTRNLSNSWAVVLGSGFSWIAGAAFYLYMPIAGMTDPPMQWGYPRTLDGFIHAITRGQYDRIHPTSGTGDNAFQIVTSFFSTYLMQLWRFVEGLNDEFNFLYLLIALVVFLFYRKMKRREQAWIIGMIALFICLGPFLVVLLNFSSDRQSLELNRVFLTSSHVFVAISVGYGLTLLAASMAAHFDSLRKVSILGALCACDFAFFILAVNSQSNFVNFDPDKAAAYGFCKMLCWLAALACVVILWRKGLQSDRLLAIGLPSLFIAVSLVFTGVTLMGDPPRLSNLSNVVHSILNALSPGHYGLPVSAALILMGAGVVLLLSTWIYRAKAPLGIMLAMFALMPSYSIMTHWFDNEQREHWFGYWFGHDMFTPPFVGPDGKLSYDAKLREQAMKGPNGKMVYPEMDRDTILFGGTDPGRFAPTYMIFDDSFIPDSCKPVFDQKFDRRDVYIITQNALADGTYLEYIRAHYFRSDQYKYDTRFFQELLRGPEEREKNGKYSYTTNNIATLAGELLDEPLTKLGAGIEAKRRQAGVYPPVEIYTPSPEDSQQCFQVYIEDAQHRLEHDRQFPDQPRQVRPGELVNIVDNKVQVSGQVAVMAINALLTKVIFDKNPTNEFFVEESFPLDWMYPHLTPSGIIMKINRQTLPEITDEIAQRDHYFWSQYSERLIGNWITYDTPVKQVAEFAEKVYLQRDFTGFKGDRKFLRDDQAQKAFSKLRSSIAGIYAWRLGYAGGSPTPPEYMPKSDVERQRMLKEADFAFKQAFAFCPYSPEAVFRYVQLLATVGRIDDAILVAETCQKLDPYNGQVRGLVDQLKGSKTRPELAQIQNQIAQLEAAVHANPSDFQKSLELAVKYYQAQQTDRAFLVLDGIVNNPNADANAIFSVANLYAQINNAQKLEPALQRLVQLVPAEPEAWYNLAGTKAALGKTAEALQNLRQALDLNAKQLAQNTNAHNLRAETLKDPRFANMRQMPEYKSMVSPP